MKSTITRNTIEGNRGLALSLTAYPIPDGNSSPSIYWNSRDTGGIRIKELISALQATPENVSEYFKQKLPADLRGPIAEAVGYTPDTVRLMDSEVRAEVIMLAEDTVPYRNLVGRYITAMVLSDRERRNAVLSKISPQMIDLYALEILESQTASERLGKDGLCKSVHINVRTGTKPQLYFTDARQYRKDNEIIEKPFVLNIGTKKAKSMDNGIKSFAKHTVSQINRNLNEYSKSVPEQDVPKYRDEIKITASFLGVDL